MIGRWCHVHWYIHNPTCVCLSLANRIAFLFSTYSLRRKTFLCFALMLTRKICSLAYFQLSLSLSSSLFSLHVHRKESMRHQNGWASRVSALSRNYCKWVTPTHCTVVTQGWSQYSCREGMRGTTSFSLFWELDKLKESWPTVAHYALSYTSKSWSSLFSIASFSLSLSLSLSLHTHTYRPIQRGG